MTTQSTFNTFMQKVEQTTNILETSQAPHNNFPPKPDFIKAQEVTKALNKTWDKMQYIRNSFYLSKIVIFFLLWARIMFLILGLSYLSLIVNFWIQDE